MDLDYDIGDRVIHAEEGVIGKVIRFYTPTTCKQQTMILCGDGRKYHAPSDEFIKVDEQADKIAEGKAFKFELGETEKQLLKNYCKRKGLRYNDEYL